MQKNFYPEPVFATNLTMKSHLEVLKAAHETDFLAVEGCISKCGLNFQDTSFVSQEK
jgi:hypothetical protein